MDTNRDKILAEIDLREALYALNRALSKWELIETVTFTHLKHARDIVWTAGVVNYEWTD